MKQAEFELDQKVKLQCLNYIKMGKVIKREYHESKLGVQIKYWVADGEHIYTPWEQDLLYVKDLPLGEME